MTPKRPTHVRTRQFELQLSQRGFGYELARVFVELDSMEPTGELRIWRLRKRNLYVDAELRQVQETGEWDLLVYYGTTLTSSRRCATRGEAVAEARARRAKLERECWTFHW